MTLYPKMIMDALATVRYPGTGKNIVEAGMVEDDLRISGLHVSFSYGHFRTEYAQNVPGRGCTSLRRADRRP